MSSELAANPTSSMEEQRGALPADTGQYGSISTEALRGESTSALRAMLLELRRRRDASEGEPSPATSRLEERLQGVLGERRLSASRQEIGDIEQTQPLRRRILNQLSSQPTTPTDLALSLEARNETISRALKDLVAQGLVVKSRDLLDRRRRVYSLTAAGSSALAEHLSFGTVTPQESQLEEGEVRDFLLGALDDAVRLRRQENELSEAIARFRTIADEAEEIDAGSLIVRARHELAATLRQARRWQEYGDQLRMLSEIADGQRGSTADSDTRLAAAAHLEYESGRRYEAQSDQGSLEQREEHLRAAQAMFRRAARSPSTDERWEEREGWALLSLAEVYRELGELRRSVGTAGRAESLFASRDDAYGRSRCLFVRGFSERLQGNFDRAWLLLEESHSLAAEHRFRRFQADALYQMGETRRCMGELDEARERLDEALGRSAELRMDLVVAFTHSALGATAYAQRQAVEAVKHLSTANELFDSVDHPAGKALTLRRLAVVKQLAASGRSDQQSAEEMLDAAKRRFLQLQSPAGVAACTIDKGWLGYHSGATTRAACESLLAATAGGRSRRAIEVDPWVPKLLLIFASRVGQEDLLGRARELVGSATSVPEIDPVAEMAGEPRRDLVALS